MSTKAIIRIGRVIRLIKKSGRAADKALRGKKKIIPISKKTLDRNLFDALVKDRNKFLSKRAKFSSVSNREKFDKLFKR